MTLSNIKFIVVRYQSRSWQHWCNCILLVYHLSIPILIISFWVQSTRSDLKQQQQKPSLTKFEWLWYIVQEQRVGGKPDWDKYGHNTSRHSGWLTGPGDVWHQQTNIESSQRSPSPKTYLNHVCNLDSKAIRPLKKKTHTVVFKD